MSENDEVKDLMQEIEKDMDDDKKGDGKRKKMHSKGKDRKGRGGPENKKHWREVEQYCEHYGMNQPECIDAWYAALDRENWLEWSMSVKRWFANQPWIAVFGQWFSLLSWWYAFDLFIWPNKMPSINDAPWEDVGFWRALDITGMTATANLVQPNWFFLSQVFSLGDSDLSDLTLIYMKPLEGVMYFVLEALYLPWQQVPALLFCTFFWWLYAAEFVWGVFDFLTFLFSGGFEQYEKEKSVSYKEWQSKDEKAAYMQEIVDKLWTKYDLDKDGELNKAEAMVFIEAVLKQEFKSYDKEGNFNEEAYKKVYNETFAEYDENKDDKLTKAEILPFIRELLHRNAINEKDLGTQ